MGEPEIQAKWNDINGRWAAIRARMWESLEKLPTPEERNKMRDAIGEVSTLLAFADLAERRGTDVAGALAGFSAEVESRMAVQHG